MSDVSRETHELRVRYRALPALQSYARILETTGVERGLIGPREVPRLWPRHLANCAVVAEEDRQHLPVGASVADVGSGAGLPGIVWALVRPDLRVTLIEPLLRRATFLSEVVTQLELSERVTVHRSRAEESTGAYDVVTARAVAPLARLSGWTLPLTRVGGFVVALKGSGASAELAHARGTIVQLGGGTPRLVSYGVGVVKDPTTVVLIPKTREPRQPGARQNADLARDGKPV